MPRKSAMLDLFAGDQSLLAEIQQAAAVAVLEADRAPWIGAFFDTRYSLPGMIGHLFARAKTPCGAKNLDLTIEANGVDSRSITCPLCRQVLEAWPTEPFAPEGP